jgi:hypothetical protein
MAPTDLPTPPAPSLAADASHLAAHLHRQGLALPAWILLESYRPFAWLTSQFLLLGEPLLRGFGAEPRLTAWTTLLTDPLVLAALSQALDPHERENP